jgi:hypothetical protein
VDVSQSIIPQKELEHLVKHGNNTVVLDFANVADAYREIFPELPEESL